MNDKITIEKEGKSITIEDEEKGHCLNVAEFTLAKDNLTVNVIEGCDDFVENNLTKKDMTYLIDNLTAMRDMMSEDVEDEDLEEGDE